MTTYEAYKKKQAEKASAARRHKNNVKASSVAAAGADKVRSASGVSATLKPADGSKTRSVSVRRDRSHSKSEMIKTSRIPTILGLAQKREFETRRSQVINKYPFAIAMLAIFAVTCMFMMLVLNAVSISDMKTKTTQMSSQLEGLIERREELALELEKRDDLRYIEEIAKNQYGMIKKDYVTKYYVSLDNHDKIELIADSDSSASDTVD